MKVRKVSLLVVVLVLASLIFASTASAHWWTASINRVGVTTGGYIVYLDFANLADTRWFVLDDTVKKGLLVVLLAAQLSGKQVMVDIITNRASGDTIRGAFMLNQ